jgi:hypothetical protein
MTFHLFAAIYVGAAAFLAVYLFHHLATQRAVPLFSRADRTMLGIAALLIALLWVLFLPGTAVYLWRLRPRPQGAVLRTRHLYRPRPHGAGGG